MAEHKTIDPATLELLEIAEQEGISTCFSRSDVIKPCPIGREGNCCKACFMGHCRLVGKTTVGICGATLEVVQARNLARAVAGGAAAHSDHGRNVAFTLIAIGEGKAPGYQIKDEKKLRRVASYMGLKTEGKPTQELALEVGKFALNEFGRQDGELYNLRRAPPKRQELWRRLGIAPRGVDREVCEMMHRTTMGVDQDPEHILTQAMRCALADGWGGSMIATDLSDIIFGTPTPVLGTSNFGVLKEEDVNMVIHGHEPTLAEMIVAVAKEPALLEYARSKGAKGINVVGMCCSGNELLMRHGVPIAGNFLQSDLIMVSGAVEAMVVDYQCIMQGMVEVAKHFHTKVITTTDRAKIQGATHIEFDDHRAQEVARLIVRTAIDNFPNRKRVHIPAYVDPLVSGFSHEYLNYMQGGIFRESFRPFAPSVLLEKANDFFELPEPAMHYPARFMLYVVDVKEAKRDIVPAITHVDGTGRVQTVSRTTAPRFYRLIELFGEATGVPLVLNTSFNLKGEPIVNTPAEAFNTFAKSGMDLLVLDHCTIEKDQLR